LLNLDKISGSKKKKSREAMKRLVALKTPKETFDVKLRKIFPDGKLNKTSLTIWSRLKHKIKKGPERDNLKN